MTNVKEEENLYNFVETLVIIKTLLTVKTSY
jgi:hypothetical protein